MARYLYYCSQCKQQYEIEKPMSYAQQNEKCPVCGMAGTRIFTAPGIRKKGARIYCGETSAEDYCTNCDQGHCTHN